MTYSGAGSMLKAVERSISPVRMAVDGPKAQALNHVVHKIADEANDYGTEQTEEHGAAALAFKIIADGRALGRKMTQQFADAFHDMLKRVRDKPNLLPLPDALKVIEGDGHGDWHEYAAKRLAKFNGGAVDMDVVPRFAARARVVHKDQLPITKAYTGPRNEDEVHLAAWNAFFNEGGALNQPYWLETDRLKELRHEFERLANAHGGRKR